MCCDKTQGSKWHICSHLWKTKQLNQKRKKQMLQITHDEESNLWRLPSIWASSELKKIKYKEALASWCLALFWQVARPKKASDISLACFSRHILEVSLTKHVFSMLPRSCSNSTHFYIYFWYLVFRCKHNPDELTQGWELTHGVSP